MRCRRTSLHGLCFSLALHCNLCSKNVSCKAGNHAPGGGGGDAGFQGPETETWADMRSGFENVTTSTCFGDGIVGMVSALLQAAVATTWLLCCCCGI